MNEKIRRYMYTHNTTHTHAWNSNICRLGTHGKRWEVERESESDQHHLALMHIIGIHMHTCTLRNAVRGCLHIQVSSWEPPKAFRFLVHFFFCFDGAVGGICCCSFVLWSALASPIFFFTHPNYADTELFHTLSVRMCMSTYLLLFLHATCVVNFFRTLAILQAWATNEYAHNV